ncbi:hypothetical protein [Natronorubrum texcoconense]|uniref:Uncharacterized protein n=1 Tax=Natronorubrum texcoconense TaxID=1095776 RepID=A0A1G8V5N9_9EURY|nr:hypothetical protein [Natronorubrum texcoconense]SDJ61309.1 hypothetical protein SAMN04515672_1181 [Natronorubrum texcoconense]
MAPSLDAVLDDVDLENDLIQLFVSEAVRAGLETPLRDPILEAVDETIGESLDERRDDEATAGDEPIADDEPTADEKAETGAKSRLTMVAQGLLVFVVLFAVLYVAFRYLLGGEPE